MVAVGGIFIGGWETTIWHHMEDTWWRMIGEVIGGWESWLGGVDLPFTYGAHLLKVSEGPSHGEWSLPLSDGWMIGGQHQDKMPQNQSRSSIRKSLPAKFSTLGVALVYFPHKLTWEVSPGAGCGDE